MTRTNNRTIRQATKLPTLPHGPVHHRPPEGPKTLPTEPAEVAERQKNSGQKDHKGGR
jgi:hypothetical protein